MAKYPQHTTTAERAAVDKAVADRLAAVNAARQAVQRKPASSTPDDGSSGYPIGGHQHGRP